MAGIAKQHDDDVRPSIGPTGKLCWTVWSTQRPVHSIRTTCYHKSKNCGSLSVSVALPLPPYRVRSARFPKTPHPVPLPIRWGEGGLRPAEENMRDTSVFEGGKQLRRSERW